MGIVLVTTSANLTSGAGRSLKHVSASRRGSAVSAPGCICSGECRCSCSGNGGGAVMWPELFKSLCNRRKSGCLNDGNRGGCSPCIFGLVSWLSLYVRLRW